MTGYTYQPASGTSTECLFVKNLQGDVERVISATGTLLASYTYDAWGNLCQSSGSLADINPIRYRSYYYDSETGLYYLQSRYYDQQAGRFVNADEIVSTESVNVGLNAFSYCENVPVSETDSNGTSPYGKLNIFDYGAIHRGVQSRCKACYGWKMEVYVTSPLGNGRLDLFDDMNCA